MAAALAQTLLAHPLPAPAGPAATGPAAVAAARSADGATLHAAAKLGGVCGDPPDVGRVGPKYVPLPLEWTLRF